MTFAEILQYLYDKRCLLEGCSFREVAKVEKRFDVTLPAIYKEFLLAMGRNAGKFMEGSSYSYKEVLELRESAEDLLADYDFKPLPSDAFVFFMHQGYQFAFFHVDGNDDPPVYLYYQQRTRVDFELVESSFTNFLESQLIMSGLK